ncbi:TPA: tetratricopeptide repeat protein [Shigella boydii]
MWSGKVILLSLGLSLASFCHASTDIDQLYERIVNKDQTALKELQKLADTNNTQALVLLGFIYEHGVTVSVDIPKAIQWYEKACNQGGEYGCYNARYFFQYGKGVTLDVTRAQKYASKSKTDDLNIPPDLMNKIINQAYELKSGAETDKTKRASLIEFVSRYVGQAPENDLLFWGRIGFSKPEMLRLATLWAQEGDPEMDYIVGNLYLDDFSPSDDRRSLDTIKKALQWFRTAAEKGYPMAQYTMGDTYENGSAGLKIDAVEAKKWYELAANKNDEKALVALGNIYYSGLTGEVDYSKASMLFDKAEQQGAKKAALWLSWMYYNGLGETLDCDKVWDYYEKGAGKYSMKFNKDEYLTRCNQDQKNRETQGDTLPYITLKHYGTYGFNANEKPKICDVSIEINADKISSITNLQLTLELKGGGGSE